MTGAGAALDAASRGLRVALVEARDYAAGTSSRSSKLIHGGLRYLEQLEFGLVHEALTERGLLATRLAPHLVRPVPILVPLPSGAGPSALPARAWRRSYYGAGVAAYDAFAGLFGGGRGMPLHRHLSREEPAGSSRASGRTRSPGRSATTTARSTTPGWWSPWPAPRPAWARPW